MQSKGALAISAMFLLLSAVPATSAVAATQANQPAKAFSNVRPVVKKAPQASKLITGLPHSSLRQVPIAHGTSSGGHPAAKRIKAPQPDRLTFIGSVAPFVSGSNSTQKLVVAVHTRSGKPVSHETVSWTTSNPLIVKVKSKTSTNDRGQATDILTAGSANGQALVTATVGHVSLSLTVNTNGSSLLSSWGIGDPTSVSVLSQSSNLSNQASSAAGWWSNANPALTIQAYDSSSTMPQLEPNQEVVLQAAWTSPDEAASNGTSQPTWAVDSPDASVTQSNYTWNALPNPAPPETVASNVMSFTASEPGVYVIQAQWDGTDSVPLVITVGESQLATPNVGTMPPQIAGVATVNTAALQVDPTDSAAVQSGNQSNPGILPNIWIGMPVHGWIPLSGQIPATWINPAWSQTVTVVLTNANNSNSVNYLLPIDANGNFSGVVASPFKGHVQVEIEPSSYTATDANVPVANQAQNDSLWNTYLDVNQSVSLPAHLAALANVDYLRPNFASAIDQAATLWYNSPDPVSGAIAISNWVATNIAYNYNEDTQITSNPDTWQVGATASQTWQAQSGVCENYSQVLVAMDRALGIPADIEYGVASSSWITNWTPSLVSQLNNDGWAHAWVAIYGLTPQPLMTDPTWNGGSPSSVSQANYLCSQYTTSTTLYQGSHDASGPDTQGLIMP